LTVFYFYFNHTSYTGFFKNDPHNIKEEKRSEEIVVGNCGNSGRIDGDFGGHGSGGGGEQAAVFRHAQRDARFSGGGDSERAKGP
jgi:hypothetical protein